MSLNHWGASREFLLNKMRFIDGDGFERITDDEPDYQIAEKQNQDTKLYVLLFGMVIIFSGIILPIILETLGIK